MDQGQVSALGFDPNFVFPVRNLETARVKLTPFNPELHAKEFFEQVKPHPELFRFYFNVSPPTSVEDFVDNFFESKMHKVETNATFAVFDKTGKSSRESPRLAGMISLIYTNTTHQFCEIGYVMTFPKFQRTYVTSNAVGLLLHYCLELPAHLAKGEQKYGPGLGLRRVQWQADSQNSPSIRCAKRIGFKWEGIIRWTLILLEGKGGSPPSAERAGLHPGDGRHNAILSMCWDDWELEGGREHVQKEMNRL
ncbi:acyl-CoA N-acyltransferase [Fomitiporia mediterranea MF3/22]|uniref:acyl-CoA N-acyltransferase n=1 Tax=Fomitiporia mediterranea (strain MF3/22) TaxID=694068 RepID=UPI00044097AA|nr:acyl-CoA N-acyltransferase [Fomitiporia mediterranea MF3/22]EJD05019.1 acyl-CoA N-acyltransferase [Fomitiporia mediterranea MF3/22]